MERSLSTRNSHEIQGYEVADCRESSVKKCHVISRAKSLARANRDQGRLTAQKLTHTGSWVWRVPDRNAVHLSEEWYRIYGFDPAEGPPVWEKRLERVHPEDRLKWKSTIERAIMEKADYDLEFRILLPNGMVKWIHTVGHPILSSAGDLKFVGSSTDITERKSAEQEREKLRQLEADLADIDRVSTLGEMAASLAHEIKQPIAAAITSANSCIEWLAHEPPNLDRPVRQQPESISMGIVRRKSSTVYVRSTRSLLHHVSWLM